MPVHIVAALVLQLPVPWLLAVESWDLADSHDGRSLGHHQARAADGSCSKMVEMPIIGETLMRRILTHG